MNVFEERSDDSLGNTSEQLVHLFRTCDRRDKGYVVREELEELCIGLGISSDDSNTIFYDLDVDNDGKISFKDFSLGFKEFLNPEETTPLGNESRRRTSMWSISTELSLKQDRGSKVVENEEEQVVEDDEPDMEEDDVFQRRKKENVYQAWTTFTSSLVDSNLLSLSSESQCQIRQLCHLLQQRTMPATVASKVECAVSSLVKEMEQLQKQNKNLEELYQKEKTTHVKTLASLETEIEDQVAKVEEKAKANARIEQEEARRTLQVQMDQEVAEMQAHLKMFQKVDTWLKNDHGTEENRVQEIRKKLEESFNTNRELRHSLYDTTSNLALFRTDLAHTRLQYEEKCKELHQEREQVLEYMHQYDHLRRQLDLIHDANKRLQDTNDCLRDNFEYEWRCASGLSRNASVRSNYSRRNLGSRSLSPPSSSQENELNDGHLGLRRLLENDLDSGHSTLPDRTDDSQLPSLEEELLNLVDGANSSGEVSLVQSAPKLHHAHTPTKTSTPPTPRYTSSLALPFHPSQNRSLSGPSQLVDSNERLSSVSSLGPPDRTYKVVLAGDAAVGKTTFITRICHGRFVTDMASTLGVDYKVKSMVVDNKHMVIQLWDTAGQERFRSITKSYFRRADGVLLLYDVTSERSFINVRQWIESINETCKSEISLIVCGNKTDLRKECANRGISVVTHSQGETLAQEHDAAFYETSTKTGENVVDALVTLARQMSACEDLAIQTSTLSVVSPKPKDGTMCCF